MTRTRWTHALLAALLLAAPRAALAQDVASAEALFRAGRELMDRGDYAAACPKLAESNRLDPSSGTALNLALCHAKQGKTATAWAEFLLAARLARQQQRPERVDEATRQAEALEKSLSHLTITVKAPVAGLNVQRDDVRLEPSSVGTPLPLDPGKHVITVMAPGKKPVTIEITLGQASDDRTITVPPLEQDSAAPPPSGAPDASARPGRGPLPWVIGGVGIAALGVGAAFGGLALSTYATAKSECPTKTGCSDDALSTRSRANAFANVANVGIPVGAVAVGAAVILLLTGPSRPAEPPKDAPRAMLIPVAGPHRAGLSLSGVF